MDSDEIAETRILARKMLRKKTRNEMIEASYNRFSTHEDPATLPSWFVEDEAKYRYHIAFAPTKEEVLAEKEAIKAYNARPSKKVEQAKMRKKKRLAKAMEKIKKKAQVIADQDLNEASKMKQIQKLYAKEKAKHKETKTYVVSRNFNSPQGNKFGRNTKVVDPRLRKDQRNKKFSARKGGHKKGKR
jgi:AdoMet-dependent rRNA methyltransferase SPB1